MSVRVIFENSETVVRVSEDVRAVQAAIDAAVSATASAASASASETAAENFALQAEGFANQTEADAIATAADRVQTGLDVQATNADAVATAADRIQTGLDRTATGADAIATAADRVQTGLDRIAASDSASSAASAALNTPLTDFITGANSTILSTDTTLQAFGKTQGQINERIGGTVGVGQVAFGMGTKLVGGDNGLFWDNTNKRLGVGTNSPANPLDVRYSNSTFLAGININNSNTGNSALSGVAFTVNSVLGGFMSYQPSNYISAQQASTMVFSSVGNNKLAFIANSNSSGIAQDIFFSTLGLNSTYQMQIKANGNVQINTNTDAGFRLDVNGTARVQGATTIGGTTTGVSLSILGSGGRGGTISPRSDGLDIAGLSFALAGLTTGDFRFAGTVAPSSIFGQNLGNDSEAWNFVYARTFRGRNNTSEGTTNLFSGTTSNPLILGIGGTENLRFAPTSGNILINTTTDAGFRLDVNGTARVQGELTVNTVQIGLGGGALGSNLRIGANALNANSTGINNIAIGGNSLLNLNSGLSNIIIGNSAAELQSNGQTLTNSSNSIVIGVLARLNANNEANQIVIGHNGRGLGSNTTVIGNSSTTRWKLFGSGIVENITAPSASVTDSFHVYANDIVAGNSAPHFRTENGAVIKLYQETTGVSSSTIVGGGGTALTDIDTFDGYTLAQIVKALRNIGALA
jgi:hypothetical protein